LAGMANLTPEMVQGDVSPICMLCKRDFFRMVEQTFGKSVTLQYHRAE
jgi:hypothetical protein